MDVSAEVRFGDRRWILFECEPTERAGLYALRISNDRAERKVLVEGSSIGDVLERCVALTAEAIAPRQLDYVHFTNPDL